MIDKEKYLSIGHLRGGQTKDRVSEGKDPDGHRFKATTDELGNTVTERHGDRQDVAVQVKSVTASVTTE